MKKDSGAIKTQKEIRLIKKSCSYADKVIQEAIKFADKNKTEIQVHRFIKRKIKELGLKPSFKPIVSSYYPKRLHRKPLNKKLKGFVIIDLGVKYKGYCSDITRMVYIGKPSKQEIKNYNKVLKLQKELIASKELDCRKLHTKAKRVLKKDFIHGIGHGIGLNIHEKPYLNPKTKDKLKDGMTFTIEPGIYKKQGIRIEDDILLKNKKKIVLTKTRKDLVIKQE